MDLGVLCGEEGKATYKKLVLPLESLHKSETESIF